MIVASAHPRMAETAISTTAVSAAPCFPIHAASFLKNLLLYLLSEIPLFFSMVSLLQKRISIIKPPLR
jgi:hypothetical protein